MLGAQQAPRSVPAAKQIEGVMIEKPRVSRHCSGTLQSSNPVPGTPLVVSNGENTDDVGKVDKGDRIRETSGNSAANSKSRCYARVERKPARRASDRSEHGVDLLQKLPTKTFTPLLVPSGGSRELLLPLRLDPDGLHGRRSFDSISARAADQSSPPSGSARTRRARRSISTTQASSAPASLGPSKLATSSSATSARSSSVSSRASPSTFWARPLMDSIYPSAPRQTRRWLEILCPPCAPTLHRRAAACGTARDRTGATCPNDFVDLVGKSASRLVSVRTLHMGSTPGASATRNDLWFYGSCRSRRSARETSGTIRRGTAAAIR